MIRTLLTGLAALLAGGGLAALVLRDPGYVLVAWDRFSFETSIWIALILLGVAGAAAWLLVRVIRNVARMPPALRDWRRDRRAVRARRDTLQGLALLMQDQPQAALKLLRAAAAADHSMAAFAWPAAAEAAHRHGDIALRDECLEHTLSANPDAREAVEYLRRRWQVAGNAIAAVDQRPVDSPQI